MGLSSTRLAGWLAEISKPHAYNFLEQMKKSNMRAFLINGGLSAPHRAFWRYECSWRNSEVNTSHSESTRLYDPVAFLLQKCHGTLENYEGSNIHVCLICPEGIILVLQASDTPHISGRDEDNQASVLQSQRKTTNL